jgi:peptidoglycan/LPS O-acetylase OafA/YrhL
MDKHLPQLDGIRGLAILIVVSGHLLVFNVGMNLKTLGPLPPVGVDLFFVLSGFLITRILLDARSQPHYFRNFYMRRALRIWPLYFAALVLFFGVTNHRVQALTFNSAQVHWPVFVLYIQNLWYPHLDLLVPAALTVTWSLAVEEQFYTVWPFLVRNFSAITLTGALCLTIAIAPLARLAAPHLGFEPYTNPLCRFDAMAMGGIVAIWILHKKPSRIQALKVAAWLIVFAAVAECACHFAGWTHSLSKTILSSAFTALLLLALYSDIAAKLLSNPVLRYFGKISYCLYLCHLVVAALVGTALPAGGSLVLRLTRCAMVLLGSVTVAELSWRFFEKPILGLKRYFPTRGGQTQVKRPVTLTPAAPLEVAAD